MSKSSSQMPQHKRLAMGEPAGMACGGMVKRGSMVPKPTGGIPISPLTAAKRNNGVPGMKKGGKAFK